MLTFYQFMTVDIGISRLGDDRPTVPKLQGETKANESEPKTICTIFTMINVDQLVNENMARFEISIQKMARSLMK